MNTAFPPDRDSPDKTTAEKYGSEHPKARPQYSRHRTVFYFPPDVVILDPPRKGCTPSLLKTVAEMSPDRIAYVSCDPATFARDCAVLAGLGYELKEYTPFDMFARTAHVETVGLLKRITGWQAQL